MPWLGLVVLGVAALSLLVPVFGTGLWDPHELTVAELGRRLACTLLGAGDLALDGADNSVPTLAELGRGQLPIQSIAFGFRIFGLHAWAGRLPLVLWALAGALGTWALVARLFDRATGHFAVLALVTMPIYFVHARTMLGEMVTMAALAVAVAGWGLSWADCGAGAGDRGCWSWRQPAWLGVGLLGMAAGAASRGLLIGVALPALAVGLAWAVGRGAGLGPRGRWADGVGAAALLLGATSAFWGGRALVAASAGEMSLLVGGSVAAAPHAVSFDAVLRSLVHGLFPWSALLPLSVMIAVQPSAREHPDGRDRELSLRLLLLTTVCVGVGLYGALAPRLGELPFGPVFALAGLVAIALRELDRRGGGSLAMVAGVSALAVLLLQDFRTFPEKGLVAFGQYDAKLPDSFKDAGTHLLLLATAWFLAAFGLSVAETSRPGAPRFRRDEYLAWPRALRSVWGGNLMFAVLVLGATLFGLFVLGRLSAAGLQLAQLERLGPLGRSAVAWGWIYLALLVLAPTAALLLRDLSRAAYARLGERRVLGALAAGVGAGLCCSLIYYPVLASQISPKEVFETFRQVAHGKESLATVGVNAASATYYTGHRVPSFGNASAGFEWLTGGGEERRFLVVQQKDLAKLNSLFREHTAESSPPTVTDGSMARSARNLPVLDARSSEILLVSNRIAADELDHNPFAGWVQSERPTPSHPVDANLGGQLEVLGWDITMPDGTLVSAISPGQVYEVCIYYEVTRSISGNWETFVHVDGNRRRFNADHKTLEGKYPLHLWRVGDYIADRHSFRLEPNFTAGEYEVLFGLFIGSRRLDVRRGSHDDNRVRGGTIEVR